MRMIIIFVVACLVLGVGVAWSSELPKILVAGYMDNVVSMDGQRVIEITAYTDCSVKRLDLSLQKMFLYRGIMDYVQHIDGIECVRVWQGQIGLGYAEKGALIEIGLIGYDEKNEPVAYWPDFTSYPSGHIDTPTPTPVVTATPTSVFTPTPAPYDGPWIETTVDEQGGLHIRVGNSNSGSPDYLHEFPWWQCGNPYESVPSMHFSPVKQGRDLHLVRDDGCETSSVFWWKIGCESRDQYFYLPEYKKWVSYELVWGDPPINPLGH